MQRRLKNLRIALAEVFAHPAYVALAGMCTLLAFVLAVWLPNIGLLGDILFESAIPIATKLGLALSLLGGIRTNFSPLAAGYTVAIAVLFGVTVAMIVYLVKQRRVRAAGQNIAIGSGAMASGVVGIGCAACGSLILGGAVPFAGAAAALAMLPLNGEEFGLLSVALLLTCLLLISRTIAGPISCPIARTGSSSTCGRD